MENGLIISHETIEKLKSFFKLAFKRQNILLTICGILLLSYLYLNIFPPNIHLRINRIRKTQPARSYSLESKAYEKIKELTRPLDFEELSDSETFQGGAELEKLLPLEFDVNRYLDILDRLKMKEGYVLDYRYHLSSLEGNPVLYARKKNEPKNYSISGPRFAHLKDGADAYLSHIKTDGSREGFIQLATLHLIGANFYLYWHAFYDDLEFYSRIPASVTFYRDEVAVSFFISTFHQLVAMHTLRVKRHFPHQYVSETRRTIIPRLRATRL